MFFRSALFVVFTLILSITQPITARVINIPDDQETIQAGIDAAEDGDTVLVQPGTYVENINFEGKAITVASLILTTSEEAYIDSTVIDGNDEDRVVIIRNDEDESVLFVGFTIQNGIAERQYGGGIYCQSSSPTIRDCIIRNNYAAMGSGGGLGIFHSNPTITNCIIYGNRARIAGGGILIDCADPVISYCDIYGNTAEMDAGGIYIYRDSSPLISYCSIIENTAQATGGIAIASFANPTFANCTICDNYSLENRRSGICLWDGVSATIVNSILWNNGANQIIVWDYLEPSEILVSYSDIEDGRDGVSAPNNWVDWGDGNIDEDPLCVDPDNDDFHLTEDSPCIDAGDPAFEFDPDETRIDIGKYYFYHENEHRILRVRYDYETIQDAINEAEDGDTVLVFPGEYDENINFNGKAITVASLFLVTGEKDFIASTFIDGGENGSVVTFNSGENQGSVLKGFKIKNGEADYGGGVYIRGAGPTLDHLTIYNNSGSLCGGIYCSNVDEASLNNLTVRDNSSRAVGGIFIDSASVVTISDSRIIDNFGLYSCGGMLCSDPQTKVKMRGVEISDNRTGGYGGGIYCNDQALIDFKNGVICNNHADGVGGAAFIVDSEITLDHILIANNRSWRCDGAMFLRNTDLNLLNVTMYKNRGSNLVEITCIEESKLTLVNTIIQSDSIDIYSNSDDGYNTITVSNSNVNEIIADRRNELNWIDGNLESDPVFIDPENGDFNLNVDSPCIDAGTAFFVWEGDTLVNMTEDEYNGEAPDMGTYETDFTGVSEDISIIPNDFILYQNYPNPFNSETVISYSIPQSGIVKLGIYDLSGREVGMLYNGHQIVGEYSAIWNANGISTGMYICRLHCDNQSEVVKLVVVR